MTAAPVADVAGLTETPDRAALAEVEQRFREQLSPLRLIPGAAVAIYRDGRLVLDLAGGFADTQRGEVVGPESLFPLFSGTKPFAAVALWQQIERGNAGLDDPVAAHWPAFAQQGKARVTLRHVLSHRGGFPLTPPEVTRERWGDWAAAIREIAAMPVDGERGTRVESQGAQPLTEEAFDLGEGDAIGFFADRDRFGDHVGDHLDRAPHTRLNAFDRSRSISTRRRILPEADFGICSTNSIRRTLL